MHHFGSPRIGTIAPFRNIRADEEVWFLDRQAWREAAGGILLEAPYLSSPYLISHEDFLPWDIKPHRGVTPTEVCLYKRDSYDVLVAPRGEGLVFVEIMLRPGASHAASEIVLDGGGRYAIDVKQWRILASQR